MARQCLNFKGSAERWRQRHVDTGWAWLFAALALLILVLIPGIGREVKGSYRWLPLGGFTLQPSEFAKLAMVVFVADLLSRRAKRMDRPDLTVRPVMVLLTVLSALLLMQPKLGTPILLAAVAMVMLFIAGAKTTSLLSWGSLGLAAAAFFSMSSGYRRDRIFAFIDPWQYPATIGLQTIQSQVGIASGGILGVGLGASRAKWGFLPEAQSDFIFAIVADQSPDRCIRSTQRLEILKMNLGL